MAREVGRFLIVGTACADLVSVVEFYPVQDLGHRCSDQYWQRGGNASNNCTVLSALGTACEFLGTLSSCNTSHEAKFLLDDFKAHNISTDHCVFHEGARCPMSVCIINKQNGSRTILHANRELPELTAEEFKKVDLNGYHWVHFEGRPTAQEVRGMLRHIDEYNQKVTANKRVTTSIELEKRREDLVGLEDAVDYVFISKEHCAFRGFVNKEEATEAIIRTCRDKAAVICPWGDAGSIARTKDGQIFTAPIFPPETVVDTIGAGDTFVASTILSLSRGCDLGEAINYGSKVAGAKVGMLGFSGLKAMFGTL